MTRELLEQDVMNQEKSRLLLSIRGFGDKEMHLVVGFMVVGTVVGCNRSSGGGKGKFEGVRAMRFLHIGLNGTDLK